MKEELTKLIKADKVLEKTEDKFIEIEDDYIFISAVMTLIEDWIFAHEVDPDRIMEMLGRCIEARPTVRALAKEGPPAELVMNMTDEEYARFIMDMYIPTEEA